MQDRKLRLGVAGLGRAFSLMLPTLQADPRIIIAAGADPRMEARAQFERDFDAKSFADVDAMCASPDIDAVYISTPHQFHRANVESAARHGKHALVEKPMALSVEDCLAMIESAERGKIHLVVGHSHSFDLPIIKTRKLISAGEFGQLRMINALQFTDFLYRPRRPEELNTAQGGGVIFNQAPHQVDNVRMVAGTRATSIRAMIGQWDATRPTEGAYQAFLTFEDGVTASLSYNGYAHFDSDEFCDWIAESGLRKDPARYGATRATLRGVGANAEVEMKNRLNYGGSAYKPPHGDGSTTRWHQHFGLLIASCDHGDLRPQPHGIWIYGNEERRFEELPAPGVPRVEVMDELCGAVFENRPPLHDGFWALATMEICFAMLQSAHEQTEIKLTHQTGVDGSRL